MSRNRDNALSTGSNAETHPEHPKKKKKKKKKIQRSLPTPADSVAHEHEPDLSEGGCASRQTERFFLRWKSGAKSTTDALRWNNDALSDFRAPIGGGVVLAVGVGEAAVVSVIKVIAVDCVIVVAASGGSGRGHCGGRIGTARTRADQRHG